MSFFAAGEKLLSTTATADPLKTQQEEKPEELPVQPEGDNAEAMETDNLDTTETDSQGEASEELFQRLSGPPQTDSATDGAWEQQQQQQTQPPQGQQRQGHEAEEDEEKRLEKMETDFNGRLSLDNVGKEGLSPEHAAGEQACDFACKIMFGLACSPMFFCGGLLVIFIFLHRLLSANLHTFVHLAHRCMLPYRIMRASLEIST